jgi:hypothetical protein
VWTGRKREALAGLKEYDWEEYSRLGRPQDDEPESQMGPNAQRVSSGHQKSSDNLTQTQKKKSSVWD